MRNLIKMRINQVIEYEIYKSSAGENNSLYGRKYNIFFKVFKYSLKLELFADLLAICNLATARATVFYIHERHVYKLFIEILTKCGSECLFCHLQFDILLATK